MKRFSQYVMLREQESAPNGRQTDRSVLPVLEKLVKLLWERYHQEFKDFVVDIGKNDPEVKEMLDRADSVKEPALDRPANHIPDELNPSVPHVVPFRADMPDGQDQ